jgi:hypothetical protein
MPMPGEPSLSLSSDGYYWFLHPLIERLRTVTGQYIDLYGDASFFGESMAALERMLAEAKEMVLSNPQTWQVHAGTQMKPEHKEFYSEVDRTHFMELLSKWQQIIVRAKKTGRPVVCFGD